MKIKVQKNIIIDGILLKEGSEIEVTRDFAQRLAMLGAVETAELPLTNVENKIYPKNFSKRLKS